MSVSPIRDWRGSLALEVVVLRDVTERKQVERLQREFIDLAAHKLRTPLTTIKGYTQVLSRWGAHNPNEEAVFGRLVAQGDRMARMIERVEQVSQLRADDLALRQQRLDLGELSREVVARLQTARTSPSTLVTAAGPAPVYGDERWLGEALRNLQDNALKFGPTGEPVEVKVGTWGTEGSIRVRDHGPGVPPERQPRLFEALYQLAPMVQPTTGLGLGLYISREVIRHHGGRIWVESEVGKGSTFAFALPLQDLPSASGSPARLAQ